MAVCGQMLGQVTLPGEALQAPIACVSDKIVNGSDMLVQVFLVHVGLETFSRHVWIVNLHP